MCCWMLRGGDDGLVPLCACDLYLTENKYILVVGIGKLRLKIYLSKIEKLWYIK